VLTVEVVGEYLGLDTHSAIYRHFRRHYGDWFLALRRVHRTTFARQAANLWRVKERLWLHLVVRAPRCRRFRSDAAFGNDVLARQTMYGFRVHVRVGIGRGDGEARDQVRPMPTTSPSSRR